MNPYRDLDDAYRNINRRPGRFKIPSNMDDLDSVVATIRNHAPDSGPSDQALRSMIEIGRTEPDALTVVLYALAPQLGRRLSRAVTSEYMTDALGDLAFVILDGDLRGSRLAHRLVNRAHNRVWRHARSVETRGVLNISTTLPYPPDRLGRLHASRVLDTADVETTVLNRVCLERFHAAVETAVAEGRLSARDWETYRDHRLLRANTVGLPPSTSRERVAAHRAAHRLVPYIEEHLGFHAA